MQLRQMDHVYTGICLSRQELAPCQGSGVLVQLEDGRCLFAAACAALVGLLRHNWLSDLAVHDTGDS